MTAPTHRTLAACSAGLLALCAAVVLLVPSHQWAWFIVALLVSGADILTSSVALRCCGFSETNPIYSGPRAIGKMLAVNAAFLGGLLYVASTMDAASAATLWVGIAIFRALPPAWNVYQLSKASC